ncbi:cytochrome P450 [Nocardia sp. alder85J]|uniref:cytochrome P450 n=1 Tax=Nocardia sp. alder85J TaxID=2862949 RepID=UPI001CD3F3F6|nr:cytochrome P450 [Nocardia sp. alder85J]MCX4096792.1 cytochrome P450 [Nocardia sp. alder85J]
MLADPRAYTDEARLHEVLTGLRAERPITRVDVPGYHPFWAVTRHADISAISRANTVFTNWPRPVLLTAQAEEMQIGAGVRTLIHMDDPQHRVVRAIATDWFRPAALKAVQDRIDELAAQHVEQMFAAGGSCDFVQAIAKNFPLYVIMSLLGVPEADFPFMLKLTQELIGSNDEELQRKPLTDDDTMSALLEMFEYFRALTAARREHPTGDLASAIANARIDGEPLSDIDTMSYYVIIATAGHDTTSATIAGGLQALIDFPEQRERLCADLDLMPKATEEMIRWVTPVKAFMRTAAEDTTVGGVPIAAGESVLLSYVSANRDEAVFEHPFRFDVGRNPNRQLAFGHGVHFCLGAPLARMEVGSFFRLLLPRLTSLDYDGTPQLIATTFVGGLKHLPIRYRMS